MERRRNVLFLCTGNSARSQMAEGLLRHLAGDRYSAYSAGLEPKDVHPLTRRVMGEAGIDIDGQYAKAIDVFLGKQSFRTVIIVCAAAAENCPRIYPWAGEVVRWAFEDPAAAEGSEDERLAVFRRVRDEIRSKLETWLAADADEGAAV